MQAAGSGTKTGRKLHGVEGHIAVNRSTCRATAGNSCSAGQRERRNIRSEGTAAGKNERWHLTDVQDWLQRNCSAGDAGDAIQIAAGQVNRGNRTGICANVCPDIFNVPPAKVSVVVFAPAALVVVLASRMSVPMLAVPPLNVKVAVTAPAPQR